MKNFFLKRNWAVFALLFRNPPIRGSALEGMIWQQSDQAEVDEEERNYVIWNDEASNSEMYLKLFKFKNYS